MRGGKAGVNIIFSLHGFGVENFRIESQHSKNQKALEK